MQTPTTGQWIGKAQMARKAQMQMAETIAVLLVFFVILGLSLMFYGTFQAGSVREAQKEQFEKEAVRIALLVSHLPEVVCSDNNQMTENCLDRLKLEAWSNLVAPSAPDAGPGTGDEEAFLFYQTDFRDSKVIVQEVFPETEQYVIYDNAPKDFKEMIPTYIPLTIRDPTRPPQSQSALGVLAVEVYR